MENSSSRTGIDVGSVFAETYTVEGLLGRGGMGAVFLASHARLPGKKVAIKVLHPELVDDEVLVRFQREAEIASRLGHPNIVDVIDYNVTPEGVPYLVLELLEGETLAERIAQGPMPYEDVIAIVKQIGAALSAAHAERIIHRDLKPQNIFLVAAEVGGHIVDHVKVLDFGISKILGSQTVKTQELTLMGTPQYMAPEQAKGEHSATDERTDLFALGGIVYEMLCGVPAFGGVSVPEVVFKVVYEPAPPLASLVENLPERVIAAVERALQKKQSDRFDTVAEFVEALSGESVVPRARRTSTNSARANAVGHTRPGVGSQRSGPSLGSAATLDSGRSNLGIAPTIGSAPGQQVIPSAPSVAQTASRGEIAIAATVSSSPGQTLLPAASPGLPPLVRPRRGLWIAMALAAVVGLAIAAFVLTGGFDDKSPHVVATTADAAILPDLPTDAAPTVIDATVAVIDATVVVDAEPSPVDARPRRTVDAKLGTVEPEPDAEQSSARKAAEAAIKRGDWDEVRKKGNRLLNEGDNYGFVYRAIAACAIRKLSAFDDGVRQGVKALGPRALNRVRSFCKKMVPDF